MSIVLYNEVSLNAAMRTPFVIQKCAMSIDGYIDDQSDTTLILSNEADWQQVYEVRASCDAILVGAGTIRADDCILEIPQYLQQQRVADGRSKQPLRVTMTRMGNLDPNYKFFTNQGREFIPLVFCPHNIVETLKGKLASSAEVVGMSDGVNPVSSVLTCLSKRGVKRLLIEGGREIGSIFLQSGGVDEIQISIAPIFIGQSGAVPFVRAGVFPHSPNNRMHLKELRQEGDMAVLTYRLDRLL